MIFLSLKFELFFLVITWQKFMYWIQGIFMRFYLEFWKAIAFHVVVQCVVEVY
jgi:hypothetical protein